MNKITWGVLIFAIVGLAAIFILPSKDAKAPSTTPEVTKSVVDEKTNKDKQDKQTESMANQIVVKTNKGDFTIELFLEESPITAGNFKKLAEEGFYNGTRFHRVIANFMIQGGDPQSKDLALQDRWGTGGPGYAIEDEFIEGLSNVRGTLSMANSGPQSGGSQFFINVVDNTNLDWDKEPAQSKHPVFGKIVDGMDVVDAIVNSPTGDADRPLEEIIITEMVVGK